MRYKVVITIILGAGLFLFFHRAMHSYELIHEDYRTYGEAKDAGLFERGWLPDIIPTSSTLIANTHELDTNFSGGEFFFSPDDAPAFIAKLQIYKNSDSKLMERVAVFEAKGYKAFEYVQNESRWIFLVDEKRGRVDYQRRNTLISFKHKTEVHSNDIPRSVLYPCLDKSGRIAQISQDWNHSDVIFENSLPQSRLVKACQNKKNDWFIVCEKGGYSISRIALKARFVESGRWTAPEVFEAHVSQEELIKECL